MADPVLIVGAGPTGLTAALELARMGVPVRLVDTAAAPATTTRAIGVQARTLELLQQRGLAEALVARGNRGNGGSIYGGGRRLVKLDFGLIDSPFPYLLFVSQAETEALLREAVAKLGVTLEREVELVALGQHAHEGDASPVLAILRHADGRLEQVRTPWLVATEGAHSLCRTTLDLPFDGKTRTEHYVLGDMHAEGDLPDSDFHIFGSDHGFLALFPMGGSHFRLIASITPEAGSDETEPPSLALLQQIYDERAHVPARLHDMAWSSWFRINSRMVSRLKAGHVLLGGDSAHIHSPAGAQGMNTGMQDMMNLGWKLAMVIQGAALPALLDTYEADRLPVMRGVLAQTETLTNVMGSDSPALRSVLNRVLPFIGGTGLVQENATARMSQIAIGYRHSPLSTGGGHGLHAGVRVPDVPVRLVGQDRDCGLQGLLDPSRFTLVLAHPADDKTVAPDAETGAWGDTLAVVRVQPPAAETQGLTFAHAFGALPSAMLVRPDAYVAWTGAARDAPRLLSEFRQRWMAGAPPASTSGQPPG